MSLRVRLAVAAGLIATLLLLVVTLTWTRDPLRVALAVVPGGLVALTLGYAAAVALLRPLEAARLAMRQLARGQALSASEIPADELGDLIALIQNQAVRLREVTEELRDEREKSETMLARLADGIVVVDPHGLIALVNRAAERSLGIAAASALGRSVAEVLLDYDFSEMLLRALRQGFTQSGEVQIRHPEERVLDVFVTRVESERGRGYGAVMVLHDLTEIRRLEHIRRDFVANVSHELRTPVASIRAMAESLLMGAREEPETAQEFLVTITRETERLTALLDDLLDLARIESGKRELRREVINAGEVVGAVIAKLRPHAERKQLDLIAEVPADLRLSVDPDALQQILVNLLDNAIKYTGQGSVTCRLAATEGQVNLTVRDTGAGIPAEDLPRIFERFYRVDKARSRELGGTGLGLSIVKHLVEGLGGSLSVESDVGQGSRFTVTLPASSR